MERLLPQPVLYEPDSTPLVSVCQGAPPSSAQGHQVLVVPVNGNTADASESRLVTDDAHLGQLDAASMGALGSAIKLHGFTGKKVCWLVDM